MPRPAQVDGVFADAQTVAGRCDCRYDNVWGVGVIR